ncbi:MAG: aldo/keto reductase [Eubacteriaceae bacterium]|jgi:aryl-alcohol dehydrogenase-like predicted oxidoreductase|nr:aldo/keto reductase [Eubacteriaceae bacterium]
MTTVTLGSTGIEANKNGFGALPIQRAPIEDAVRIIHKACDNGVNYFDTARAYSDSEEKLGAALKGRRGRVFIATKTMARDAPGFWADLEKSLSLLKTDYIDVYQFHNPAFVPKPDDGSGLYEAMLRAKEQGKIRHIGITNHGIDRAMEIASCGLYETLQFPFSYLCTERETDLVDACARGNVGFVAMKSLSGGIITNAAAAYAWAMRFHNVLPIWGVQRESELDEFLFFASSPPVYAGEIETAIEKDRSEIKGSFCRGCGYCMPCPQGIAISECARFSQMVRRMPPGRFFSKEFAAEMDKARACLECGQCKEHCPYGLDTPSLLKANLLDYDEILAGKAL